MKKAPILFIGLIFPCLAFSQKWYVGARGGFFMSTLNVSGDTATKTTEPFGIGRAFLEYIVSPEITIELNGGYKRSFGGKTKIGGTAVDSFWNIGTVVSFLLKYYFPLPPVVKKISLSIGVGPEFFTFKKWVVRNSYEGMDLTIATPIGIYYDIAPKIKLDFAIFGDFAKSVLDPEKNKSSLTLNIGFGVGAKIGF